MYSAQCTRLFLSREQPTKKIDTIDTIVWRRWTYVQIDDVLPDDGTIVLKHVGVFYRLRSEVCAFSWLNTVTIDWTHVVLWEKWLGR
jgi:hypothetical protein